MTKLKFTFLSLVVLVFLTACASPSKSGSFDYAKNSPVHQLETKRMLVKSANIRIEVNDPDSIANEVTILVETKLGYIESIYSHDQDYIRMIVKIPAVRLDVFIGELASKGKLISKSIHTSDVTEETIDIAAKLKNFISLREKFHLLLVKAEKVSEILSIEKELSRIQTKIDAIEGRRKVLNNQVEFSRVEITLKQETIYGPLGYLGKGVFWFFKKLFVIQ